jgi:hypothetical protein
MYSIPFLVAKSTDLALVTIYYFTLALASSIGLQMIIQHYDSTSKDSEKKSTLRLFFEVVFSIFFVALTFWVIRNIVERIPFPLEGYGGYKHARLHTTATSGIAALTLILFQTSLTDKIRILNYRLWQMA